MKYFLTILLLISSYSPAEETKPWIEWDSQEGLLRFQRCEVNKKFLKLLRFYESQTNLTYCGVASLVVVLNALSVEPPPSKYLSPFRLFTQKEFFSEEVSKIIDVTEVEKGGLNLKKAALILRSFPLNVVEYNAMELDREELKPILLSALKNSNQYVLALYHRKALNQIGEGHWFPVAAYDKKSDSFLILDVARFKYPPVWVEAEAFLKAMQTSNAYGNSRGFLVIDKLY